ncbi:hypothetical protein [Streptomyces pinistramenti]|uniref:hypothetical protein n=1 Tax=Streptomyces pinistramenti TaxID=2884812 RepID=UPI001D07756F|nr:hypothetical protein [Streptomyces pinistramenti]MCB5911332.1 hypothetical protein [Streptomyces pinistramenti]
MAPRLRTRFATGLLVLSVALPVPAAALVATASPAGAAPNDRSPLRAARAPGTAADPLRLRLTGGGAEHHHHHHGGPATDVGLPGASGGFPGLAGLSDAILGILNERPHSHGRYAEDAPRSHVPPPGHPHGPPAAAPPPVDSAPGDDIRDAESLPANGAFPPGGWPGAAAASGTPGAPDAARPSGPPRHAAGPDAGRPAPGAKEPGKDAPPGKEKPSRPAVSPSAPPSSAVPPSRPWHPQDTGTPGRPTRQDKPSATADAEGQRSSSPAAAEAEPPTTGGPYAFNGSTARVERVLPMGAGLALTGLGLAFLALRLRRY